VVVPRTSLHDRRAAESTKNGRPTDAAAPAAATPSGWACSGAAEATRDRQDRQRSHDEHHVEPQPAAQRQPGGGTVRVGVAGEQHGLEEHETGVPDRRSGAELRQQAFANHRLHEEQQAGAEEHCRVKSAIIWPIGAAQRAASAASP
jgi:hypothetical protein